jgi:hypothetical protein
MQRKSVLIIIGLCLSLTCGNQALANAALRKQQPTVQEILRRVAEALGGEDKLKKIRSLSISLNFRHSPPPGAQMELKGKNEFLILLPDKFLKSETLEALNGASALTRIEVVDGDRSWGEINAGGHEKSERFEQRFEQGLVIREAGLEQEKRIEALRLGSDRSEFTRLLLALLLTAPPAARIEWSLAESADDSVWALDAKGTDEFAARLFIDRGTYLPLRLSYRPKIMTMAVGGVAAGEVAVGGAAGPGSVSRVNVFIAAPNPGGQKPATFTQVLGEQDEVQLRFSDYRAVDGLLLPHRIVEAAGMQIGREWEITQYQINPPLQPEMFQPKRIN